MDYFEIIWIFLLFFAGFGAAFVWQWQLRREALSITRYQAGEKGRKAKKEQESELVALISEAAMEFKEAKAHGEDMQKAAARIFPQLMQKYPEAVMKHGKKLLKSVSDGGGLEALEDLIR